MPTVARNLASEPRLLSRAFNSWTALGVPPTVPRLVTEYGYSAQAAEPEVDLAGGLLNADFAAHFLTLGGTAAYVYGYEPNVLDNDPPCTGWGNNMLFKADDNYQANDELATYWVSRMLTEDWAQPADGVHALYTVTVRGGSGHPTAPTAYAVHRPDGRWALLVINKDSSHTWTLDVGFQTAGTNTVQRFAAPLTLFQFGPAQYAWHANGDHGETGRSDPPDQRVVSPTQPLSAPPSSVSVLVGPGP